MSGIQVVYVQYLPWFDEYELNFQSVKKSEPGIEKRTNMNNAESRCPVKKLFSEDGKRIRATTLTEASSVFTILFFTF
jgi:hypothetical protein